MFEFGRTEWYRRIAADGGRIRVAAESSRERITTVRTPDFRQPLRTDTFTLRHYERSLASLAARRERDKIVVAT